MSFINKLENIEYKICEKIKNNINKIRKGYKIIHYEINEKIFYSCSQVICLNGFRGTIWDIEKALDKEYKEYKKSIKRTGITIDNICYYIETEKIDLEKLQPYNISIILINKIK